MRMFYVHLNGMQQGPYDEVALRQMNLAPNTPVWCKGMRDWAPLSSVLPAGNVPQQPRPRAGGGTIVQMPKGANQRQQQQPAQPAPQRPAMQQPAHHRPAPQSRPAPQPHPAQPQRPVPPVQRQPEPQLAMYGGTESDELKNHDAIIANAAKAQGEHTREHLSLWGYYKKCWRNYFTFRGRARRTEYWSFALFNFLMPLFISLIVVLLILACGLLFSDGAFALLLFVPIILTILNGIYALAVFIPGLAVISRRLHDTGKGFGWFFLILVPLIGAITLIIFFLIDSEPQTNRFGPNPKA